MTVIKASREPFLIPTAELAQALGRLMGSVQAVLDLADDESTGPDAVVAVPVQLAERLGLDRDRRGDSRPLVRLCLAEP